MSIIIFLFIFMQNFRRDVRISVSFMNSVGVVSYKTKGEVSRRPVHTVQKRKMQLVNK